MTVQYLKHVYDYLYYLYVQDMQGDNPVFLQKPTVYMYIPVTELTEHYYLQIHSIHVIKLPVRKLRRIWQLHTPKLIQSLS